MNRINHTYMASQRVDLLTSKCITCCPIFIPVLILLGLSLSLFLSSSGRLIPRYYSSLLYTFSPATRKRACQPCPSNKTIVPHNGLLHYARETRLYITMIMMAAHNSPAQVPSASSPDSDSIFPNASALAAPFSLSLSKLIRTRSARRRTVCFDTSTSVTEEQVLKPSRRESILRKLAGPRENAKRFLRLRSSGVPSQTPLRPVPHASRPRPVSEIILSPGNACAVPSAQIEPADMRSEESPTATEVLPRAVPQQSSPPTPELVPPFPPLRNEKIVATGSGITVGVALTEPVLYLQGYDQHDPSTKKSAILRGQLHLKISKCVKIKKISICFRGHAQTNWPDGATLAGS